MRKEQNQTLRVYLYNHYEYQHKPLAFICLPDPLEAEQKANILQYLEGCYGDTEQETTDWALEITLWLRMLLCNDSMMINPHHLELDQYITETICEYLGHGANATVFANCAYWHPRTFLEQVMEEYRNNEDAERVDISCDLWPELAEALSAPVKAAEYADICPVCGAVIELLRQVDEALKRYGNEVVSVDLNEETGMLDINLCYHSHSDVYATGIVAKESINKKALIYELDARRVGYTF